MKNWYVQFLFFQISINVTDVNDCIPIFENDTYLVEINENSPNGYEINLDISANDADISADFNTNSIRYEISNDVPFEIDPITGKLSVKLLEGQSLDYESDTKSYKIYIYAKNKNSQVRSSKTFKQEN